MKKTRLIALTAVFSALYFVLSAMLKIPVTGHISLDLGYIALTVGAVYLGAVPGMLIGMIGVAIESTLFGHSGISLGWIMMNAVVGFALGFFLHPYLKKEKKALVIRASIVIPAAVFIGVVIKTLVDCLIKQIPLAAKVPSSLAAFVTDSIVCLAVGLPLCFTLKRFKF